MIGHCERLDGIESEEGGNARVSPIHLLPSECSDFSNASSRTFGTIQYVVSLKAYPVAAVCLDDVWFWSKCQYGMVPKGIFLIDLFCVAIYNLSTESDPTCRSIKPNRRSNFSTRSIRVNSDSKDTRTNETMSDTYVASKPLSTKQRPSLLDSLRSTQPVMESKLLDSALMLIDFCFNFRPVYF